MHLKFSFRRMEVRWLIQLPTSFQECNEAQHTKWKTQKTDSLHQKSKEHYNKNTKREVGAENYAIKSRMVHCLWSGKIRRFGYDFTVVWGQFHRAAKLHSVNRHVLSSYQLTVLLSFATWVFTKLKIAFWLIKHVAEASIQGD